MTSVVISLVIIALAGTAAAYVYGYSNGSQSVQHPDGPETCRAKLQAAETVAQMWRARALEREEETNELRRQQAEHERNETLTVELLLAEIEQATAAAAGSGQ